MMINRDEVRNKLFGILFEDIRTDIQNRMQLADTKGADYYEGRANLAEQLLKWLDEGEIHEENN